MIRPFVYVREYQTREFSRTAKLPIVDENCPACFEGPKERYVKLSSFQKMLNVWAQSEHVLLALVSRFYFLLGIANVSHNNVPTYTCPI